MRKDTLTKVLAFVLSLTFVLAMLVSCGGENTTTTESTTNATTESTESTTNPEPQVTVESLMAKYNCITLAKAIELSPNNKDVESEESYYVCGTIVEITNTKYGQMIITDGKDKYEVYGVYLEDGTNYEGMSEKPVAGDIIVVHGKLGFYKEPEMKKATLVEYYHEAPVINKDDYKSMSVLAARDVEDNTNISVEGVVIQLTYANGMTPNGFFVTDGTDSIYVYGSAVANSVKVGNKVTVAGTRIHYVSDTEKENAQKYGYKGCCQIADPVLLSNDNGTNTPDMKWVKTKSVKEIVENDITTNVTTTVYRTVAVIKRAEGVGYVNYYIDDLDNHTGSYCYSSNNGNDFEWLNAYVGKIVELYVSPINAKSAASGCNYRFVPISIIDPDYKLDPKTIPSIVYDCFVSGSIAGSYDSVGSIEVPTTVDAELLGVKATVSYASSDESVIAISNGVLSIKKSGSAKITITVTIDGSSTKYEKDVTVAIKDEVASITVKEAIDTADDVEIIVKGIVASGISNQVGFYLIDETGAIAVKCSADELAKVKIGELVVVKGTKTHFKKADGYAGQSCILDSTIENNLHGNDEYSTNAFLGNMTVEDMVARDVAIDYSTEIHVVTATLKKGDKAWTVISDDGSAYITLYAGSVDQYSWLGAYDGQKVTMDFALCNWNAKKPYKACVLAVYTDSGKIVNPGKLG